MKKEKQCVRCGEFFIATLQRVKFCSRKCQLNALHDGHIQYPSVPCKTCGVVFRRGKHQRTAQYCSGKCRGIGQSGENHHNWKGGRRIQDGYVLVLIPRGHPARKSESSGGGKYMGEHRRVMEKFLGRYLESYEEPHHKNGDRQDNRIENLELWSKRNQPPGQRVQDLVAWAKEILRIYRKDMKKFADAGLTVQANLFAS